jgi:hypothetical protein
MRIRVPMTAHARPRRRPTWKVTGCGYEEPSSTGIRAADVLPHYHERSVDQGHRLEQCHIVQYAGSTKPGACGRYFTKSASYHGYG